MFDPAVLAHPGTVLLDTARPDAEPSVTRCFSSPAHILTADVPEDVSGLLRALADETARGRYVAGLIAYEAGYPLMGLEGPVPDGPLAWFGVYDEPPERIAPGDVERALRTVEGDASLTEPSFALSREAYTEALRTVRHHIREGDVYQINVTAPLRFELKGDPRILYRRLRARQHAPYGAYLNLGDRQVLSCSPELFFRQEGRTVTTRPMKGTAPRGRTLTEDRALQEELAADPKNRAENLMIVDLLRNDLSVCCTPGSVTVPRLYETEAYDTVTQMTSTVQGTLQEGAGLPEILEALFPCGSVTGAPKHRAMQIIRSLEQSPRGVYCGAVGFAGPDDTAVFNVAIRTAVLEPHPAANGTPRSHGTMGVGSGVVWDSDPEAEYEECRLKGQFLADAGEAEPEPLKLIETMRFDGVMIPLLDGHVRRLKRSAAYFGIPFDEADYRERVQAFVQGTDLNELLKVRTLLDRWGNLDISSTPLDRDAGGPMKLCIAEGRVDPNDVRLFHKTTRRSVYERPFDAAQAAGYDEALLLNTRGEVTEGTRTNLFIREGDRYWTPPVDCGLLAGVYRDHVLRTQEAAGERVLTLDDLQQADALYCCNAVRGWHPAHLSVERVAA